MNVGFVGLGAMGQGMARNLHRAGCLAGVWNRHVQKAQVFADDLGCRVAKSLIDLTAFCDVLILCVSADADVRQVISTLLPGLGEGKVVIDCSTVSARTAREVADLVRASGADFLDCPVTGGVEGAVKGSLTIMAGGEARTLEQVRPFLSAMGQRIIHFGPVGSGQAAKAVNQVIAAGINQAVTEGLAFGAALELPMDKLVDAVSGGAASSWFLQKRGPTMIQGVFKPGFKLSLHDKDLAICQAMALEMEVALPIVEMTRHHYRRLLAAGHGDEDISVLYRLKQAMLNGELH